MRAQQPAKSITPPRREPSSCHPAPSVRTTQSPGDESTHVHVFIHLLLLLLQPRQAGKQAEPYSYLSQTIRSVRSLTMGAISRRRDAEAELNLPPGFRFHPTDEELVVHYLRRKVAGQRLPVPIIAEVDLYRFDPWDLPDMALFGNREWYFYTPRDRKYPNGSRPNRAARTGYWKATGADKPVSPPGSGRPLGIKKALVFYQGKAPRGVKTDWIMHEYRLADTDRSANKKGSQRLDDWVLCRLYHKKNGWEKMQQKKEVAMDPVETNEDTRSDSIWTQESDIEHDAVLEFGHPWQPQTNQSQAFEGLHQGTDANGSSIQMIEEVKEESDWFMGLNLDDFQSSLAVDISNQDYYTSIIDSPYFKQSQTNMPTFWS